MGDANAPVTVVEYTDIQCPFCGRWAREEFASFKSQYIDTGKVRFVIRHFPLRNIHPQAEPAARASECSADQSAFFEFVDSCYADQSDLSNTGLRAKALGLSLNMTDFDACFPPADAKATRVQTDVTSGNALGITGTPTFFINARRASGFQTTAQLGVIIEQELGG